MTNDPSRELDAARIERAESNRLENQRFVRQLSGPGEQDRPFQSLDLAYRVLRGLQLEGADFSRSLLANTDFSGAKLQGASFVDSYMISSDLNGADLTGADFSGASLSGADLRNADLSRARLGDADLPYVCYDVETRWPSNYAPDEEPSCDEEVAEDFDDMFDDVWGK